jgi:hypothetical protein
MARTQRQELLRDAVVEAARHLMARQICDDRLPSYMRGIPTTETQEAWQTLRDSLFAERKARHG